MSRKSAASLAIVTPAFGRPDPPPELKSAEVPLEWYLPSAIRSRSPVLLSGHAETNLFLPYKLTIMNST